jgi:hypothetical protein
MAFAALAGSAAVEIPDLMSCGKPEPINKDAVAIVAGDGHVQIEDAF